ncbi:Transmembrane exosortase [Novipirellula aureliae]|uniref:Transmembrane exosortase n=2 Tax=Novipirellula aureliae TaxID=2527966 RepID=A0A5C6DNW8_9BACT|nr:Transmembrane exosortase [Novipirellula aureliae]
MPSTLSDSATTADVDSSHSFKKLFSPWVWFWGAFALVSLPMLVPYFIGMWRLEHYQYFPFVFIVVGALAYSRIDRETPIRGPQSLSLWIVLLAAAGLICSSLVFSSTWFAAVGFVLIGIAFFGSQAGTVDETLLALSVPLLMLVRLPVGLDQILIKQLQGVTTQLASVLLDVIGVTHAVQGNIIQLAGRELLVAEACSGVQSVFTLAFLASVIIAYFRRRLWLLPFYVFISLLLAIFGNVIRVTTVAVAEYFWGMDLANGLAHDMIGYIALAIAGLLLLSFDQLVITILHPASDFGDDMSTNPFLRVWDYFVSDSDARVEYSRGAYSQEAVGLETRDTEQGVFSSKKLEPFLRNRVVWASMLGIAAVLTIGATIRASNAAIETPMASLVKDFMIYEPTSQLLDGEVGALNFVDHRISRGGSDPKLGKNSDVWTYEFDNNEGQFVISQTYTGWHELCVCYENMEWKLIDREVCAPLSTDDADFIVSAVSDQTAAPMEAEPNADESYVTGKFKQENGTYGYLIFGAVFKDGTICPAPSNLGAYGARFLSRLELYGVVDRQELVMVQLWFVSPRKLEPELLDKLKIGFEKSRQHVADAMASKASGSSTAMLEASRQTDSEQLVLSEPMAAKP